MQLASIGLFLFSLAILGVWVLSGVFGLPIIADAIVVATTHRSSPLMSGLLGVAFVAIAVFVVWLAAALVARAPQFRSHDRLRRVLFGVVALDLGFWAVAPALTSLHTSVWTTYGAGAVLGSAGYAAWSAAVQHAHPADSALGS